ncbi:MAG: hypothetical protein P4M01_13090 [Acidobacteriota bacterium]|nr:hypothetical protein [Acidobacteriota bacterium]
MSEDRIYLLTGNSSGASGLEVYRPYTRALLRRYMRLASDLGRLPSILGGLCFRARLTSYRVHTFEDAVIFVHDVERAFERVSRRHMEVIAGVVLLDYSLPEAALRMGISVQRTERRYSAALDELARVLLESGLLQPVFTGEDDLLDELDEEGFGSAATATPDKDASTAGRKELPPRIPPASVREVPSLARLAGLKNAQGLGRKVGLKH